MLLTSRREIVARAEAAGLPPRTAVWLVSCLSLKGARHPDQPLFQWLFDPAGARALLQDHDAWDAWPLMERGASSGIELHLVCAERSARWAHPLTREALARVAAGAHARATAQRGVVAVHTLPKAGHWVHVDAGEELVALLKPLMQAAAGEAAGT